MSPIVARQLHGKIIAVATDTHVTVERIVEEVFYAVYVVSKESRRLFLIRNVVK
jgi:hypothetical protein